MANTECSCSRPLFTVQCKDCDCIQKSLQQLIILIVVRRLIGLKKIGTIRNWMMSNIRQTITDKWLLQIYNSNTTNDVSQTIKINALIKVIICGISKAILDIWLLTTHTSWCTIILHHELRMLIIFFCIPISLVSIHGNISQNKIPHSLTISWLRSWGILMDTSIVCFDSCKAFVCPFRSKSESGLHWLFIPITLKI